MKNIIPCNKPNFQLTNPTKKQTYQNINQLTQLLQTNQNVNQLTAWLPNKKQPSRWQKEVQTQ